LRGDLALLDADERLAVGGADESLLEAALRAESLREELILELL
jgi:hypothetical protein